MLDLADPDHAWLRALVSKAFTPRLIERLRGRIEALGEELDTSKFIQISFLESYGIVGLRTVRYAHT
jgi:hypothetical protein